MSTLQDLEDGTAHWKYDADGNQIDANGNVIPDNGYYQETINQQRRDRLRNTLKNKPDPDFRIPRRKDGRPQFECFYRTTNSEIRCPLLTMAAQRANHKSLTSGFDLVPAAFNASLKLSAYEDYKRTAIKSNSTVSAEIFKYLRRVIRSNDPSASFLMIFDDTQKEHSPHVHGLLLFNPHRQTKIEQACISTKQLLPQNQDRHIKTSFYSRDSRKAADKKFWQPVGIGWTGYMALHVNPQARLLDVQMCTGFTGLLNEQYDIEYERQQKTGRKPRQYGAHALDRQSRYGTSGKAEKDALMRAHDYQLACNGDSTLHRKKWHPPEYYEWHKTDNGNSPIPADLVSTGPDILPMPIEKSR